MEAVLCAIESLAVRFETVARHLVAPKLAAYPPLDHAHTLGSVHPAEDSRLVVVPATRSGAATGILARLCGHIDTDQCLVVFAKAPHAIRRIPKVWLLPTLDRLASFDVDVVHAGGFVRPAHSRSLFYGPAPKRLTVALLVLAAALGNVDHHFLLVGLAEARLSSLEAKAWSHLIGDERFLVFRPETKRKAKQNEHAVVYFLLVIAKRRATRSRSPYSNVMLLQGYTFFS